MIHCPSYSSTQPCGWTCFFNHGNRKAKEKERTVEPLLKPVHSGIFPIQTSWIFHCQVIDYLISGPAMAARAFEEEVSSWAEDAVAIVAPDSWTGQLKSDNFEESNHFWSRSSLTTLAVYFSVVYVNPLMKCQPRFGRRKWLSGYVPSSHWLVIEASPHENQPIIDIAWYSYIDNRLQIVDDHLPYLFTILVDIAI
jgi:hypothetical protein